MSALYESLFRECVACLHPGDRFIAAALAYGLARRHGLEPRAYCEMAIAAAELASNAVRHAGGGQIEIRAIRVDGRHGVELDCRDRGPGIADVALAFHDGASGGRERTPEDGWGSGLGTGLGAVRRASHDLEVETSPGHGTRVVVRRWARAPLRR